MFVEDERSFKSSAKRWICNKLFAAGDSKVRDDDHVIEKCRHSDHWNCNINLKFTKKISVIFYNFKGYESHLIDVKICVIPNRLEKYMAFTINKNLVFTDSMKFVNSRLDVLVKNSSDNDFNHLSQWFGDVVLNLLKQTGMYPFKYVDSS